MVSDEFVGSFLLVSLMMCAIATIFGYLRNPASADILEGSRSEASTQVPVADARNKPEFWLGLLSLCAAAGFMSLVMSIGPLAGHHSHLGLAGSAVIIQWHLVGMFAPALVSGVLLAKVGPRATGTIGAVLFAVAAAVGASDQSFWTIFVALALNGVAWNLLFLAGSSLIVRTYAPGQGGRIQAVVEGSSTGIGAVAAMSAGMVYREFGWQSANLAVLVFALIAVAVYGSSTYRHRGHPAGSRNA